MGTEINKIKQRESLLALMCILFIIAQLASILFYSFDGEFDLSWTGQSVLMAVMCIVLYFSYRTHTKNIMKPLLGAFLMLLLYYEMDWTLYYIENFNDLNSLFPGSGIMFFVTFLQISIFIMVILINIMHYVINCTHHSSPNKILFNRVLCYVFIILVVVLSITFIFTDSSFNIMASDILGTFSDVFFLSMVLIIERNLDDFRIQREAKTDEIEA